MKKSALITKFLKVCLFLAIAICWNKALVGEDNPAGTSTFESQLADEWTASIRPMINQYCSDCHGESTQEASVDFSKFDSLASVRSQPALWDQVSGLVRIGAMPPSDAEELEPEERERIANWIENSLHRTDCGIQQLPGHVTVRRLNNTEYDNTIRDLLRIDDRPSQKFGFISDDVGNGFDNQGEVLTLPPLLMEKYLTAAESIAAQAIVIDRECKIRRRPNRRDQIPSAC
jgi:Protein of unknown function (DUF1587)/Cytochrome C oxidase, cbb3-type, subunit III